MAALEEFAVAVVGQDRRISLILHLGGDSIEETRGQGPLRPAATRAMRNRHVILYDFHYLGI